MTDSAGFGTVCRMICSWQTISGVMHDSDAGVGSVVDVHGKHC